MKDISKTYKREQRAIARANVLKSKSWMELTYAERDELELLLRTDMLRRKDFSTLPHAERLEFNWLVFCFLKRVGQ